MFFSLFDRCFLSARFAPSTSHSPTARHLLDESATADSQFPIPDSLPFPGSQFSRHIKIPGLCFRDFLYFRRGRIRSGLSPDKLTEDVGRPPGSFGEGTDGFAHPIQRISRGAGGIKMNGTRVRRTGHRVQMNRCVYAGRHFEGVTLGLSRCSDDESMHSLCARRD